MPITFTLMPYPPTVFYPSETLFNLDTFVEVLVLCVPSSSGTGKYLVINENGTITDSVINVNAAGLAKFHVYEDTTNVFKAMVQTMSGVQIYKLPGTLPCNTCVGSALLGFVSNTKPNETITTQPFPNPSANDVKIAFDLPPGVAMANLVIYNSSGQKIRSFQVDSRFGYIMLDISSLSAGLYYYNIESQGVTSVTQKLLVVR